MGKNISEAERRAERIRNAGILLERSELVDGATRRLGKLVPLEKGDAEIYAPGATESYYVYSKDGRCQHVFGIYSDKGFAKMFNIIYDYEVIRTVEAERFSLPAEA